MRKLLAQAVPTSTVINPMVDIGTDITLAEIFTLVTNLVIGIGIALTVIFLVLGGIQYITSRGNPKSTEQARSSLINAVVGFIVVISAVTIRYVLENVLAGGIITTGLGNITPF